LVVRQTHTGLGVAVGAGHQIDPVTPRRWLLIDREMPLPDTPEATGRWSLDHLFLDQDAVPTIVEVKRSTDTHIRREVVGQMIEYAANSITYLDAEGIRTHFEVRCRAEGQDPAGVLGEFTGSEAEPDVYWATLAQNIGLHKLRLICVTDVIGPERTRMVEFLNEQMRTMDVLAVELKQYRGDELRTLVPRVIGLTAVAEAGKQRTFGTKWSWDRFAEALMEVRGRTAFCEPAGYMTGHNSEPASGGVRARGQAASPLSEATANA